MSRRLWPTLHSTSPTYWLLLGWDGESAVLGDGFIPEAAKRNNPCFAPWGSVFLCDSGHWLLNTGGGLEAIPEGAARFMDSDTGSNIERYLAFKGYRV